MIIDKYKTIVMEHSSFEGNRGDSCAETSRYAHLKMLLGDYKVLREISLEPFITLSGYIRHPEVPDDWKEKDFSSDQALPLFLALRRSSNFYLTEEQRMENRIKNSWYRTGNGDLVTPGFFAELADSQILRSLFLLLQILIFKFPYRWNDEKKSFEKSEGSSADYLNFIHIAVYAPKWVRKLISKETLKSKIDNYYSIEPRAFVVPLYHQVIEKFWS